MRYLKVTLLCGLATCLIVSGLFEAGAFSRADRALWELLGGVSDLGLGGRWPQYLVIAALGFGIAWTTIDIYRTSLKAIIAAGALLNVISAAWVLNLFYIYFSPFPGALATLLSFAAGMIYARSEGGKRKKTLRLLFGERLSRRTFYALMNAKEAPMFSGEMREATVVVSELVNHEELMDALSVEDYVTMSNLFLQSASEFLVEKGGYLNECDGESLRVIFGAPLPDERHALTACEAALELSRRLDNLNRECETRFHRTFDYRIGINSDEMVAAAFGSNRVGTFSVAGEPVEFARRLCAANVHYGSKILIGAGTFAACGTEVEVRPMDLLRGKGQAGWSEVYELLAIKNSLSEEEARRRDTFWKGVIYFREERWDDALDHFQSALTANGNDAPVEFYLRRIQQMRAGAEPAESWLTNQL